MLMDKAVLNCQMKTFVKILNMSQAKLTQNVGRSTQFKRSTQATCTLAAGYRDDNTDQYIIHSMHSANWQLKCLLFEIYVSKYISTADSHQGFIRHSYTIPSVLWCCWM